MEQGYWNDMDFDTEEDYFGWLESVRIAEEKKQLEDAMLSQLIEENRQAVETGECPHCHESLIQGTDGLFCAVCYHVYGEPAAESEEQ